MMSIAFLYLVLTESCIRITLLDMKTSSSITIRLNHNLKQRLDQICKRNGQTRSEVIRDALRHQLDLLQFEQLRRQVIPYAKARGYLTDEDVLSKIS